MKMSAETGGPFVFDVEDLQHERLQGGIEHTLRDYEEWRDANPELIADHVNSLTDRLQQASDEHSPMRRLGRLVIPGARQKFTDQRDEEYVRFFGSHNLGMRLDERDVDFFRSRIRAGWQMATDATVKQRAEADYLGTILEAVESVCPDVKATALTPWLKERLVRLQHILPEEVVAAGTMGNVLRVTLGVMALASHDVMDEPLDVQTAHLRQVIPGAYVYGASYALVDEVMESELGSAVPKSHKEAYERGIRHGLATGGVVDTSKLPDHPLAEELDSMYQLLRQYYPIDQYPHLYHAAESMYLAQERDNSLDPFSIAGAGGIRSMYPDMVAKSAMTRVIADILGRRDAHKINYSHFLNENFAGQMRDDFEDSDMDRHLENWTPFSVPYDHETETTNPLYDLFAYDAYIVHRVCEQDPQIVAAYIRFSAGEIGCRLAKHPEQAATFLQTYPHTAEIARFVRTAQLISPARAELMDPDDIRLLTKSMGALSSRRQTEVDPRTFVGDRLAFINNAVSSSIPRDELLSDTAHYAIEAGGKRLRPALTLMLAAGLGIPQDKVIPLLQSVELFHTSSLVFDDLPAQDNAKTRRDRPATHIEFDEWAAQLAGISAISQGFGILTELKKHFPSDRVNEVVNYASFLMGIEGLCKGQAMDLLMERGRLEPTVENIIEMYHYKTSLGIEAALVPLMMVTGRSEAEIALVKRYAHHAGIVFQIRDDILDMTATAESLGKDVQADANKVNLARSCGLNEAQELMEDHLARAIEACRALPFNTNLLIKTAEYFASRKK